MENLKKLKNNILYLLKKHPNRVYKQKRSSQRLDIVFR